MSKGIDIRAMVLRNTPPDIFTIWTAMDYLRATGRGDGPLDGKCEVCHKAPEHRRWMLCNYLDWHCEPCAMALAQAEYEATVAEAVA
jgi:hypothetical protein